MSRVPFCKSKWHNVVFEDGTNGQHTSGILHYLDPIDVLRKQLSLSDHSNTKYIPQLGEGNSEGCRVFNNPMRTNFAEKGYVDIRTKVFM